MASLTGWDFTLPTFPANETAFGGGLQIPLPRWGVEFANDLPDGNQCRLGDSHHHDV